MYKLTSILILLFLVNFSFAQQDTTSAWDNSLPKYTTILNTQHIGGKGLNYWKEKFKGHWAGIHIGFNGFANTNYSNYSSSDAGFMDNNLFMSSLLDINLFQFSLGIQQNRNAIGFVTGLGLQIQTFRFDDNKSIEKTSSRIEPETITFDSHQKSKLSSTYLTVPLLLEFQLPVNLRDNRMYFSTGILFKHRLSSHTKIKYRSDNKKEKLKTPDDYYMHDFNYSAMVRLGYKWVRLFGTYDLRPLFKKDKGPDLYPFSFGITLLSF